MALLKGKQIATGSDGINTANLVDGILSADASGRAKMAASYFDSATVNDKFAASSIALSKLAEAVIQADGGQDFTADQSMGGFKLTNLGAPSAASDAARKQDVDAVAAGLSWKDAVRAATTAALPAVTYANGTAGVGATLTADANGALAAQDGVTLVNGDRLLVKNQAAGLQNGLYEVTDVGSAGSPFVLTRVTDADTASELPSAAVFVQEGTTQGDTGWTQTADSITVGTTALSFVQFTGVASLDWGEVGDISSIDPDDAASAGVLDEVARADHQHAISTDAAVTVSGTTSNAEGSSGSFARADHGHDVATGAPTVTIKSDATAASEGTGADLLRADAQIVAATAAPVAVGTANAQGSSNSLSRADHVHDAPAPATGNKNMTASVTTSDNDQATATTVAAANALGGYMGVKVNGLSYLVGDGTKASVVFYFSGDGGTTARAFSAVAAGDTLHFNGSVAGFQLAASDRLDIEHIAF